MRQVEPETVNVLHVVHWPSTGITSLLKNSLANSSDPRFRYHVLFFIYGRRDMDEFRPLCETVHCLHYEKSPLRAIVEYDRVLRKLSPDLIHTHMFQPGVWGRLLSVGKRIMVVSTVHNMYPYMRDKNPKSKFKTFVEAWSINLFNEKVMCVSEAVLAHVQAHTSIRKEIMNVIWNGIDLTDPYPPDEAVKAAKEEIGWKNSCKVVMTAGRLEDQKGLDILLDAFSKLVMRSGDTQLLILGEGSLEDALREQSTSLGLDRNVQFLGFKEDVRPYLALSSLYVCSSRWEGLPMSLVEALSAGVPVVATSVGGIPEIILDQFTGLLVEPERPDQLADMMLEVLENDALAEKFRAAGRQRVQEHFNMKNTIREYEEVYLKCLSGEK